MIVQCKLRILLFCGLFMQSNWPCSVLNLFQPLGLMFRNGFIDLSILDDWFNIPS